MLKPGLACAHAQVHASQQLAWVQCVQQVERGATRAQHSLDGQDLKQHRKQGERLGMLP